jgi:rSAM/selenodomain-associated transferase 2
MPGVDHFFMNALSISVIIPALFEQETINTSVASLFRQDFKGALEIIVVDGDPHASTISAIEDSRVRKVLSERGRASQMNKGASVAEGSVLLFLHADTEIPDDGLERIRSVMSEGRYSGGAFDLGIRAAGLRFRVIERVASLRARLTRIPYGDQALFFEKAYFLGLGGFRVLPLMEDVELMRRVKKAGGRVCIISSRVSTSARRWENEGVLYCTLRNWILVFLFLCGVAPERLARFYRAQGNMRNAPNSFQHKGRT